MAISKIKKIEILSLQKNRDELLLLLQKLGIVELIAAKEPLLPLGYQANSNAIHIVELEDALSCLASFKEKSGILGEMIRIKPLVYQEQLKEVIANFDYRSLLQELNRLREHLKNLCGHRERLIQERRLLFPWQNFNIPLDQTHPTKNCGVLLGILARKDYQNLWKDFQNENLNLFLEAVNQNPANIYLSVIYIKEEFERLESILKNYHLNFITLTRHPCTVKERIFEIDSETLLLDDQIQDTKAGLAALSKEEFKLMVVYDYLVNMNKIEEADSNLIKQQFTFSLSGWIRQKDAQLLEQEIARRFQDAAIFISEPQADEEVPVTLENKWVIQPFEFITSIYGMPKYNELDPTPFLAPFFFLYFGFCVSDVGYGLMVILISWFVLRRFRLGAQGLKFFRLFLFCGVSAVIIGALTGSWFGNLLDMVSPYNRTLLSFKKFKDTLVVLDPLKEPTRLLGIALSLGIIQVWFGNVVAAIGNIKNRRYLDVLFDQIPMLTLLMGLTGLGLVFLKLLANTDTFLFRSLTLCGSIALILTQGRSEKGIGAKLFFGTYNLYNSLSGYLSDILSYSRLWALGLVTGVMANTINLISAQFSQIFLSLIPFINRISLLKMLIGTVILIIIFVLGHTVSFLMSLLGAFVHPLRLQFVEFFSKFFKSGGSSFKPFKIESKYINFG